MRRSKASRIHAEINMVPFIDVVLVLLVIFMITTPLLIQGHIKVRLPKAVTAAQPAAAPATVVINAEGKIFLHDQETGLDQLVAQLKKMLAGQAEKTVIINADRGATHGRVVSVLDAAKQAGADKLAIATDQVK